MSETTLTPSESPWNTGSTADHGTHAMSIPRSTLGEFDYRANANRGHGDGSGYRGEANVHQAHPDARGPRVTAYGPPAV